MLTKKPVNGMKDILPREMRIREYLLGIIKETYRSFGFVQIETPIVEHVSNLLSKQGGDNEKLIFKILKRGEKLSLETATSSDDLVDSGLRYDLTLPLARYYSNNASSLPSPFKVLQIGSVFRADRPQKGRFRQFTQCDIDILGDESYLSEVDLISATSLALSRICPQNHFTVRINDRRILRAMASYAHIAGELMSQTFITLDKLDKIGVDGVSAELVELGISSEDVQSYMGLLSSLGSGASDVRALGEKLGEHIEAGVADRLADIMDMVSGSIVFDPTLVRGMGYYTGTIFEVTMDGLGSSVAGGGRYDEMIGKFTGTPTPACGFSIGFERIITILMDSEFEVPDSSTKKAILVEKGVSSDQLRMAFARADEARAAGQTVTVLRMNKNKRFQKEQLAAAGYGEFEEVHRV